MDILSALEITDIQDQIAPAVGDEMSSVLEFWDFVTPELGETIPDGGVGIGNVGMPVEEGSDPARPDQKRDKLAEYPAQIVGGWQGTEEEFGAQVVSASRYTIFFNAADDPQIGGGARLLVKRDEWAATTAYSVGDVVQPTTSNGRFYVCKTAGTSDAVEPEFEAPVYPDVTVDDLDDDTVVWEYGGYLRSFEVKLPGGKVTYEVLRRVLCEEIKT
jgi:hypothetical protein